MRAEKFGSRPDRNLPVGSVELHFHLLSPAPFRHRFDGGVLAENILTVDGDAKGEGRIMLHDGSEKFLKIKGAGRKSFKMRLIEDGDKGDEAVIAGQQMNR